MSHRRNHRHKMRQAGRWRSWADIAASLPTLEELQLKALRARLRVGREYPVLLPADRAS